MQHLPRRRDPQVLQDRQGPHWTCPDTDQHRHTSQTYQPHRYYFLTRIQKEEWILFLDGSTEDWRRIYDVNVIGLCICTRETVKVMMESPDLEGHVVNINAVSHVYASPNSLKNVFPSSKQAVSALMETLRQELGENRSKRIKASVSSEHLFWSTLTSIF